eukprot:scaffold1151_cov152-Amphora_coffeaeformis.AAC.2
MVLLEFKRDTAFDLVPVRPTQPMFRSRRSNPARDRVRWCKRDGSRHIPTRTLDRLKTGDGGIKKVFCENEECMVLRCIARRAIPRSPGRRLNFSFPRLNDRLVIDFIGDDRRPERGEEKSLLSHNTSERTFEHSLWTD